jgi:imidazolonepropionase
MPSPEFDDADAYLDFALAEVLPEAATWPRRQTCSSSSEPSTSRRRRYLECRDAGLALRLHGDQFNELGASAREGQRASVDQLGATGAEGVTALAASDVVSVLLPASALFLDRPMPPARSLLDAGAAVALATDFNPGSAFCESLPLVCSLACTQLRMSPEEALGACTVNAAHVLTARRAGCRLAPGHQADLVLLDAPDWRHLAYHLGGDLVSTVIRRRTAPASDRRYARRHASRNSAAAGRKSCGTTTNTSTSTARARKSRSRKRSARPKRSGRSLAGTGSRLRPRKAPFGAQGRPRHGVASRGGRHSSPR